MERISRGGLAEYPNRYVLAKQGARVQSEVPITDENNHLFILDKKTGQQELVYQGSQTILDLLTLFQENGAFSRDVPSGVFYPRERHLAFFDIYGSFHNFVLLDELKFDHSREGASRSDIARFWELDQISGSYNHLEISIPEIYCLSLAQHPVIWEGNGIN